MIDFPRYLASNKTVDDRTLYQLVWEQLKSTWIHVFMSNHSMAVRIQFVGGSAEVIIKKRQARRLLADVLVKATHAW